MSHNIESQIIDLFGLVHAQEWNGVCDFPQRARGSITYGLRGRIAENDPCFPLQRRQFINVSASDKM